MRMSLQKLSCMVRVFPSHRFLSPYGWPWRLLSDGLQAKFQAQSNGSAPDYKASCHMTHLPHPSGIYYGDSPLNYSFTLLLLELILVVATIHIVRFLLKPFKQPRIISEIIGGIIVGPSVLGRNKTFSNYVFPDNAIFVVRNIGIMGFMFFLFVTGVKMDISHLKRAGRKHLYMALIGVIVPTVATTIVALITRKDMDKELAKFSTIGGIASNLGITAFPVLYPVLKELNLLSSDVGRMAITMAIISDAVAFIMTFIRRAMEWIVEKTPQGQLVDQSYVIVILLGVFVMGFLTDMFGLAIANGPLWLGLIIPDGPPLGSTLVERSETILVELLMPFTFAMVGLYTDVFAMIEFGWSNLMPLFAMVVTGYISKFVSTLLATFIFELPVRDGVTISLIMSLRGQIELLLFVHWVDKKMIQQPSFTLLVLLTTAVTAILTPFITILHDPTKPYMVNKRRTIQHTPPNSELRIVLCIFYSENVAGLINLLEVSNPTISNPFSIYALHIMELIGRAAPVFIDHQLQEVPPKYSSPETMNALKIYKEMRGELVKVQSFTTLAPKRTMYQNVCEMAIEKKATFILLPFHKDRIENVRGTELVRHNFRTVNVDVFEHAPCSVGILVDKGDLAVNTVVGSSITHSRHHFAVLFLGGADAREALAYADRMIGNLDVSVTVIRFLSHNYEGDDEMEKKLDDGLVTWFWVKNESNNRVVYREVVVKNGEETIAAIQAMNDESYDLWIVGRKHGINPVLLEGLSDWSDSQELGVIGDYVSSVDFSSTASVLVVQQQILRG
ncbi:Cation/H(+) antiporter like [Quillaja saponaria]|uniref:Cation/H(+) antiporter like n=1 Tax=Quillaja saponaria TaxID=32244 RepID=A0AAD7LMT9_QUISA|nr:Cation/H(+) antiporter like [Quillaja saponaria]